MGSPAGPKLLKTCLTWFRGGSFLFRLLGLPCALLALHLELYGTSTATTTFILRRLRRRLLLLCMFKRNRRQDNHHGDGAVNTFFFLGGADVMDRPIPPTQPPNQEQHQHPCPRSPRRTRRPTQPTQPTLHLDKDQALRSGALLLPSPTIALTPPPPDPHHISHHHFHLPLRDASQTSATDHPSAAACTLPPRPPLSLTAATTTTTTTTMSSHTRSSSHVDVVKQGKRLSLQFPIQPAAGSNSPAPSPRSRPQSWIATPSPVPSPEALPSPTENNFLAILAAQERYVLELREELAKAEEDLKQVKKHWATHQTIKQRNELRRVTQLQPLRNDLAGIRPDQDDEDGSTLWMQKEMERRKALLNGTRTSQRKVFSGSRHLRTLSLLSPDKPYAPSFPQPPDVRNSRDSRDTSDTSDTAQPTPTRSSTSSDRPAQPSANAKDERYDLTGLSAIQRDALLRTGKQMAADFKDGLLTFIEDIRQATVGEEAANNADPSASSAAQSTKGPRKSSNSRPPLNRASSSKKADQSKDIAEDFWKEHGLSEPKTAPTQKKTHPVKHNRTPQNPAKEEDFDEWDNWDTPNDNSHDKAAQESEESDVPSSPVSGQASSRTSTRYHSQRHDSKASTHTPSSSVGLLEDAALRDGKRNSIPWPDLVKLSPTNLKRTASHLMKEWEKNLTPPPESRDSSHASGDYIGRSASPAQLP